MPEFFKRLCASDLMPHGICWGWEPWAVWTNVVPDAVIALSYLAITIVLVQIKWRRKEVRFSWIAFLAVAFIFACGLTHAMEVYNTWHGAYRLAGAVKIVTAAFSLGAAVLLVRLNAKIIKAPDLDQALALRASLHAARKDRSATQSQLEESQERLGLLIEGVQDYAIFMLDPKGVIVSWNRGAERVKGYSAEEALGRHCSCFYLEEDVAAGGPGQDLAEAEAAGACRRDGWRVRKDGTRFRANVIITALRDGQGRLKGFAKVTRDITQQAEAEARLNAFNLELEAQVQAKTRELHKREAMLYGFIRHATSPIAFKGVQGHYLMINPRMQTLLGRPQSEIIGRTVFELYPDAMGETLHANDLQLIESGRSMEIETQWTHPDGSVRDYLSQRFPLMDETGQCWGLGILATDITERKQVDHAMLQTQKLESMGLLAGGIAHDFNNILGAILGNLGLAQMEISPLAPAQRRLETMEALVTKAADLSLQMLAYSGRGKFVVRNLNLNELVEEMTQMLSISIAKKVVIRYRLDPKLGLIEADASQLQQVVMNLVINASEAIGERSGSITLSTGLASVGQEDLAKAFANQGLAPGLFVALEIADNGCGMTPETLQRIFDPFFTTKFTGRGLGLAAIQGIVRGHKGGIQVTSVPGRGTTFRLLFPATSLPAEAEAAPEEAATSQGSGTVLVVDDEETIRAMATNILVHAGFATLQAGDGMEALEVLRKHPAEVCLVVMDLTMPHQDGDEAFQAMRDEGFTMPVILNSGFSEMEAVHRFLGKGLAGFLQKPYRAADLIRMVRSALGKGAQGASEAQPPS